MERKYNDNITLIKEAPEAVDLATNEYYVLMVTDWDNKPARAKSEYFDYARAEIGLECTSSSGTGKRIYISKKHSNRRDLTRGKTFVAKVANRNQCYSLTY